MSLYCLAECYWSFLNASFAEVARCSSEEAAQHAGTKWCLHNALSLTLLAVLQIIAEELPLPNHHTI
jgi:hypothetical protein